MSCCSLSQPILPAVIAHSLMLEESSKKQLEPPRRQAFAG